MTNPNPAAPLTEADVASRTWSDVYRELLHEGVPEKRAMARADIVRIELEKRLAARATSTPAGLREALEAHGRLHTLIEGALRVQREGCDHKGIGKPGCGTCDPAIFHWRDDSERIRAALQGADR